MNMAYTPREEMTTLQDIAHRLMNYGTGGQYQQQYLQGLERQQQQQQQQQQQEAMQRAAQMAEQGNIEQALTTMAPYNPSALNQLAKIKSTGGQFGFQGKGLENQMLNTYLNTLPQDQRQAAMVELSRQKLQRPTTYTLPTGQTITQPGYNLNFGMEQTQFTATPQQSALPIQEQVETQTAPVPQDVSLSSALRQLNQNKMPQQPQSPSTVQGFRPNFEAYKNFIVNLKSPGGRATDELRAQVAREYPFDSAFTSKEQVIDTLQTGKENLYNDLNNIRQQMQSQNTPAAYSELQDQERKYLAAINLNQKLQEQIAQEGSIVGAPGQIRSTIETGRGIGQDLSDYLGFNLNFLAPQEPQDESYKQIKVIRKVE